MVGSIWLAVRHPVACFEKHDSIGKFGSQPVSLPSKGLAVSAERFYNSHLPRRTAAFAGARDRYVVGQTVSDL